MKFYLISDNVDTQLGMRLAGIEGKVVHEDRSFWNCWKKKCMMRALPSF